MEREKKRSEIFSDNEKKIYIMANVYSYFGIYQQHNMKFWVVYVL